jgi:hypothetical protein
LISSQLEVRISESESSEYIISMQRNQLALSPNQIGLNQSLARRGRVSALRCDIAVLDAPDFSVISNPTRDIMSSDTFRPRGRPARKSRFPVYGLR